MCTAFLASLSLCLCAVSTIDRSDCSTKCERRGREEEEEDRQRFSTRARGGERPSLFHGVVFPSFRSCHIHVV